MRFFSTLASIILNGLFLTGGWNVCEYEADQQEDI